MHLPERKPQVSIAPMHHSESIIKEAVINTTMQSSSIHLSKDSMNPLGIIWKALGTICAIHNINFSMPVGEQELEHCKGLEASMHFVLPDLPYRIECSRQD